MILNLLKECKNTTLSNPATFKFKTNAQKFTINFKIKDVIYGNFPHVGISAHQGIMVLYKKENDASWLNVDAYTERQNSTIYMHHLVKINEEYEVLIIGPILSKLDKLDVEIPDESKASICNDYLNNLLVIGGPHSFGIGCTTSAFTFSSIIGRKLGSNMSNLTFYQPNYLKLIHEYYENNENLEQYDLAILEVDYVNQTNEDVEKYLVDIIHKLQKHCKNIICWYCIPKYKSEKIELVKKLLDDEFSNGEIKLYDFSFLYENEYLDICTYSGNFINDSGNVMIYKKFKKIIEEILLKQLIGGF